MYSVTPGTPQGGSDLISDLRKWFQTCGFFTKHLMYVCIVVNILNTLTDFSEYLANIPEKSIGGIQIWRFITSPIASFGILELIFSFLAFLSESAKQEQEWGTIKTTVDFFLKNLMINIVFVIFGYLFYIITPFFAERYCYGLFQIFFVQLVGKCLENPEGVSMVMCLPVQIKTKFYPIALWCLFSLISGFPRLDILIALLVGFVHYRYLNEKYQAFLTSSKCAVWENSPVFTWMKDQTNYVTPNGNVLNAATLTDIEAARSNIPDQPNPPAFSGKGVNIGEGEAPKQGAQKKNDYVHLEEDSADFEMSGGR